MLTILSYKWDYILDIIIRSFEQLERKIQHSLRPQVGGISQKVSRQDGYQAG